MNASVLTAVLSFPADGASQRTGDELLHDLVRTRIDLLHAGVCIHPGYRVLRHVPVTPEKLKAAVDDVALLLGQPVLGHRRGRDVELTAQVPLDAVVDEHPADAGDRGAFGEFEA